MTKRCEFNREHQMLTELQDLLVAWSKRNHVSIYKTMLLLRHVSVGMQAYLRGRGIESVRDDIETFS